MNNSNKLIFNVLAIIFVSMLSCSCSSDDLADGFADGTSPYDSYHAQGWTAPESHGAAFIANMSTCEECHGTDLSGGISKVSCEQCHDNLGKRCNFCHGSGAGNLTPGPDTGAHLAHVKNEKTHLAYACDTCHNVPESFDAESHIDGEPGAEITFSDKAGASAAYSEGNCSAVYCHGENTVLWTSDASLACNSCHGDAEDSAEMSGYHARHLAQGIECSACHAEVVADGAIKDRALHVDGAVSVDFATCPGGDCSYDFETKNCTQSCHGQAAWGGDYHPDGWISPSKHGYAFESAEGKACADCHGEDLAGGSSGVSCDQCHSAGTDAWKSNCTFCHGGAENESGAPPEGVFGESMNSERAVGAHSTHVQNGPAHDAYGCEMCHPAYSSIEDEGHINQQRVVTFSDINDNAEYKSENASCSALYCHGNGRNNSNEVSWTSENTADCRSCHGYYEEEGEGLSGRHDDHIEEGIKCATCHKDVIDNDNKLIDKQSHINGQPDVNLSVGQWNAAEETCTNICHENSSW